MPGLAAALALAALLPLARGQACGPPALDAATAGSLAAAYFKTHSDVSCDGELADGTARGWAGVSTSSFTGSDLMNVATVCPLNHEDDDYACCTVTHDANPAPGAFQECSDDMTLWSIHINVQCPSMSSDGGTCQASLIDNLMFVAAVTDEDGVDTTRRFTFDYDYTASAWMVVGYSASRDHCDGSAGRVAQLGTCQQRVCGYGCDGAGASWDSCCVCGGDDSCSDCVGDWADCDYDCTSTFMVAHPLVAPGESCVATDGDVEICPVGAGKPPLNCHHPLFLFTACRGWLNARVQSACV